jgi:hypothetical protein
MATPTKPNSRLGTYVVKTFKDESFRAYMPPPLPPDPPLALQPLLPWLEQANQALGRLDGLASILPDPSLSVGRRRAIDQFRGTARNAGWHPSRDARAGSKYYAILESRELRFCQDLVRRSESRFELKQKTNHCTRCRFTKCNSESQFMSQQ